MRSGAQLIAAALGAEVFGAAFAGVGRSTASTSVSRSTGVNTPLTVVFTPTGGDANAYGPASRTITTFPSTTEVGTR